VQILVLVCILCEVQGVVKILGVYVGDEGVSLSSTSSALRFFEALFGTAGALFDEWFDGVSSTISASDSDRYSKGV
jgi:hypothetical protein